MITDYWIGVHESPTTALRLCARSSANGVLKAVIAGGTYTGDTVSTATNDAVGKIDITGLVPNTIYPFDLYLGDTLYFSGTTKTLPEGALTIATADCFSITSPFHLGHVIAEGGYDILVLNGDFPYVNYPALTPGVDPGTVSINGEALKSVDWSPLNERTGQLHAHYRALMRTPGVKEVIRKVPCIIMTDDHNFSGNNAGNDVGSQGVTGLNYYTSTFVADQAAADVEWQRAIDAFLAYAIGNPAKPDSVTAAGAPRLGADRMYTRVRLNSHVEIFMLDCMAFRDPPFVKTVSDPTKIFFGPVQMAWLKAALAASTAKFKLLIMSKEFIGGRLDGMPQYGTEKTSLEDYINAAVNGGNPDAWVAPGGVAIISGDVHSPSVFYEATKQILNVTPTPATSPIIAQSNGLVTHELYKSQGDISVAANAYNCIGKIAVDGESMDLSIIDYSNTRRWGPARISAGSNAFAYVTTKSAIGPPAVSGVE